MGKKTNEISPISNSGNDIISDKDGHLYVTGNYGDSLILGSIKLAGGTGSFIAKFDANGNALWAVNACTYGAITPSVVNISPDGYLYVTGRYYDSAVIAGGQIVDTTSGAIHGFLAKYDSTGTAIWAKGIPFSSGDPKGLAFDDSANVFVNYHNAEKFSSGGTLLWSRYFTDTTSIYGPLAEHNNSGVAVDAAGNVYTSGFGQIIGKRNNRGDSLWLKRTANIQAVTAIDGDSGYIYVSGSFQDSANFQSNTLMALHGGQFNLNMYIAKYDSNGNNVWAKRAGCGVGSAYPEIRSMCRSLGNNIIICGSFADSAYFDSETLYGSGPFVAEYDAGGSLLWAKVATYYGGGHSRGVTSDTGSNVYIVGDIFSTIHFDTISLDGGSGDLFIARLSPTSTSVSARGSGKSPISTWPNPADQWLTVKTNQVQYSQLGLYDALGRLVFGAPVQKRQFVKTINIGNVATGIYYLRLTGTEGSETQKVIIRR